MEDENLLDDELAGPTTNVDSPATFSKKLILKFRICHGSTGTDAVTHNNNSTINTGINSTINTGLLINLGSNLRKGKDDHDFH